MKHKCIECGKDADIGKQKRWFCWKCWESIKDE